VRGHVSREIALEELRVLLTGLWAGGWTNFTQHRDAEAGNCQGCRQRRVGGAIKVPSQARLRAGRQRAGRREPGEVERPAATARPAPAHRRSHDDLRPPTPRAPSAAEPSIVVAGDLASEDGPTATMLARDLGATSTRL